MERLTKRGLQGFAFYPRCFEKCDGMPDDCGICEEQEKQVEALAAYEDTGLTPEEIKARKWISVDDELPDVDKPVLAVSCGDIFVAELTEYNGGLLWNEFGCVIHDITHWMPLPELPREEDNEAD